MNPTSLLRRAKELRDPERVKLLWFLQSLLLEDGGDEQFANGIRENFSKQAALLASQGQWQTNLNCELEKQIEDDLCTCPGATNLLLEFMRFSEAAATRRFHLTNIGRKVWETLDWCFEERRPCFIEGLEGRGKSASTRAWCEAHRGEARYVTLQGLGLQRDFFVALAEAYGVPVGATKAPNEIRFRLRDVIVRSKLMLVIDEAHFCLPDRSRANRAPLVDWIDTALCNSGVAVALVTTPQFGPRLAEFEKRTTWNARQFKRRFSGCWRRLDDKTNESDLRSLTQKIMPGIGSKGIDLAVGFAGTSGRDVSGLFDLIGDAERRARKSGRSSVTYQDLHQAYKLDRVPSENAMAESFKRPVYSRPGFTPADTLPDDDEAVAAPLQRISTPDAMEITTAARGRTASLLVTH